MNYIHVLGGFLAGVGVGIVGATAWYEWEKNLEAEKPKEEEPLKKIWRDCFGSRTRSQHNFCSRLLEEKSEGKKSIPCITIIGSTNPKNKETYSDETLIGIYYSLYHNLYDGNDEPRKFTLRFKSPEEFGLITKRILVSLIKKFPDSNPPVRERIRFLWEDK